VGVEDEEEASPLDVILLLAGIELIAERPDMRIVPLRLSQVGTELGEVRKAKRRPGRRRRLTARKVWPRHIGESVNHGRGEYTRDEDGDGFCEVHVNTMEGFWSLLRS